MWEATVGFWADGRQRGANRLSPDQCGYRKLGQCRFVGELASTNFLVEMAAFGYCCVLGRCSVTDTRRTSLEKGAGVARE